MSRAYELTGARLPSRLRDLPEAPERVFVVGELTACASVAIVGTRTPSAEMSRYARELACELSASGVCILSGGAKGIDTQAHLGALDAGGRTVVIAPSSFDQPYPAENGSLYERIVAEGGAYLSLYEHGVAPAQPQFFARNAMLAALCHALVVVETRLRGGARNAAKWARELSRPVFAVTNVPWHPLARGCLEELKLGAKVLTSAADVLDALALQNAHPLRSFFSPAMAGQQAELPWAAQCQPAEREPGALQASEETSFSDAEAEVAAVLDLLGSGPKHPDELCRLTGLSARRLSGLLLTLTLKGILVSHPSGFVSKVTV